MRTFTAFAGHRLLATGDEQTVARAVADASERGEARVLVFEDATGGQVELDRRRAPPSLSGASPAAVDQPRGRGRPKLGVTAREVTLLPRHWDWLAQQPGGASAALRRLVENAARSGSQEDCGRARREATYRAMAALAGDLPGFEDASRALFAADRPLFQERISGWPLAVRSFLSSLWTAEGVS